MKGPNMFWYYFIVIVLLVLTFFVQLLLLFNTSISSTDAKCLSVGGTPSGDKCYEMGKEVNLEEIVNEK